MVKNSLGYALLQDEKPDQAEAVLRKAVADHPHSARAHATLGVLQLGQRKWEEARAALDRAVSINPDDAWARANLAWVFANCPESRFHNLTRALEHARKVTELDPNNRLRWNHLGAIQYRAGMWQQALETLQKAERMENAPDNYHRIYLVMANWRLGNKHEALKHWAQFVPWMDRSASSLNPLHSEELRSLRAEAEGFLREFGDPETIYLEILRVEPKSAWAHYGLADCYDESRQWAKSGAAYIQGFDLEEPAHSPTWHRCAYSLVQAGDIERYRKLCEAMTKRYGQSHDPNHIALLAHTCVLAPNALADRDRIVQLAEQRVALAANIDRHKLWSTHVLGLAFYRAGQFEKAIATLEAGQKEPNLTSEIKICNWLALAMSRHGLGQDVEAAAALESARDVLVQKQRKLDQQRLNVQNLFRETESLLRNPRSRSENVSNPPSG